MGTVGTEKGLVLDIEDSSLLGSNVTVPFPTYLAMSSESEIPHIRLHFYTGLTSHPQKTNMWKMQYF